MTLSRVRDRGACARRGFARGRRYLSFARSWRHGWWRFFVASALQASIEAWLNDSCDLRIAIWRVKVARSQYRTRPPILSRN
jgi:outer membrane protein TolC